MGAPWQTVGMGKYPLAAALAHLALLAACGHTARQSVPSSRLTVAVPLEERIAFAEAELRELLSEVCVASVVRDARLRCESRLDFVDDTLLIAPPCDEHALAYVPDGDGKSELRMICKPRAARGSLDVRLADVRDVKVRQTASLSCLELDATEGCRIFMKADVPRASRLATAIMDLGAMYRELGPSSAPQ